MSSILIATMLAALTTNQPAAGFKKIIISPQAVSIPAFRYTLLPPLKDMQSGNAVPLYYRCMAPDTLQVFQRNKYMEHLEKWLQLPYPEAALPKRPSSQSAKPATSEQDEEPETLPTSREEASQLTSMKTLDDLDRAARRTYAEWEYLDGLKASSMSFLLPEIQSFYFFRSIIQTRARLALMNGDYDRMVYLLQTGYAMVRHLNETHITICSMYGLNIARSMDQVIEEAIQLPATPNLYWALTALPASRIDLMKALAGERMGIDSMFGNLDDLQVRIMTPEEVQRLVEERVMPALRVYGESQNFKFMLIKEYPRAKAWLKRQGRSDTDLEKMTATQAVLLYGLAELRILADDYQKIMLFPVAERLTRLQEFTQRARLARDNKLAASQLGLFFLASSATLWETVLDLDRTLAILRSIEALRHYLASHPHQLPPSWAAIKDLAIPVDPATNEPFPYQHLGDHVRITVNPVPGAQSGRPGRVYGIYLK